MRRNASATPVRTASEAGRSNPAVGAPHNFSARLQPMDRMPAARNASANAASSSSDSHLAHGVHVLDKFWEETHAKASDAATRLVPGLVLIEPPVRIARCLANIQPPWLSPPHIVQQNDVNGVPGASVADRDRPQRAGRPQGLGHPVRLGHRSKTHISYGRLLTRAEARDCP